MGRGEKIFGLSWGLWRFGGFGFGLKLMGSAIRVTMVLRIFVHEDYTVL